MRSSQPCPPSPPRKCRGCPDSRSHSRRSQPAAQPVRFGLEQGVQRLLHAPSHDPVEVALDPLVVNRDDIVQRTRCSLGHGGSFSLTWLRLAQFSQIRGRQPYLIVRKILYVIVGIRLSRSLSVFCLLC